MGFVCGSAARAELFLLLLRMGWDQSREQRMDARSGSWGCSHPSGSFQAAGSDPALLLMQQIHHRMEFVPACDIKIVLLHHCLC